MVKRVLNINGLPRTLIVNEGRLRPGPVRYLYRYPERKGSPFLYCKNEKSRRKRRNHHNRGTRHSG